MSRRIDIASRQHCIEIDKYILHVDLKMHVDSSDDMDIVSVDRIRVVRVFDIEKQREIHQLA
jgi:hypothetical protein